jgi:hypothetical protein
MPLFKKKEKGPEKTLDELVAEAKTFIENVTPKLEPDEDLIPTVLTDHEINALALPGPELQKALEKIGRKSPRWVFWATAWQAEGVTDPSVRAADHPDRFEVVIIDAADAEADRRETWRAMLTRVPGKAPLLGAWERSEG